jgi:hypothetical protein
MTHSDHKKRQSKSIEGQYTVSKTGHPRHSQTGKAGNSNHQSSILMYSGGLAMQNIYTHQINNTDSMRGVSLPSKKESRHLYQGQLTNGGLNGNHSKDAYGEMPLSEHSFPIKGSSQKSKDEISIDLKDHSYYGGMNGTSPPRRTINSMKNGFNI